MKNPFDQLDEIKISLPEALFNGFSLAEVRSFADHWNIKVKKVNGDWELRTDDPINLFWFGCNVNNHQLPQPSNLSRLVQIEHKKIPHKDLLKLAGVKDISNNHEIIHLPNGKIVVKPKKA